MEVRDAPSTKTAILASPCSTAQKRIGEATALRIALEFFWTVIALNGVSTVTLELCESPLRGVQYSYIQNAFMARFEREHFRVHCISSIL